MDAGLLQVLEYFYIVVFLLLVSLVKDLNTDV